MSHIFATSAVNLNEKNEDLKESNFSLIEGTVSVFA
jgi:hypothetical protein